MKNFIVKYFALLLLFSFVSTFGCQRNIRNRFILTNVKVSLCSFKTLDDCIMIEPLNTSDSNIYVRFDFNVKYSSDNSVKSPMPATFSEGFDGPLDTINSLKIFLDSSDISNYLTNNLSDKECSYLQYHENSKKVCRKIFEYDNLRNSLPCFESIDHLVASYNREAPFLWEHGLTCFLEIKDEKVLKQLKKKKI